MSAEETVPNCLAEGLVALLPVYRAGAAGTEVFTLRKTYQLYHSIDWTLELFSRYCRVDLKLLRRQSGRLLGVHHHIPLPFSEGLVLLPVKVRLGDGQGETTVGYVNFPQIEGVEGAAPAEAGRSAGQLPGTIVRKKASGGTAANLWRPQRGGFAENAPYV